MPIGNAIIIRELKKADQELSILIDDSRQDSLLLDHNFISKRIYLEGELSSVISY